jgi:hypothetical protein
MSLTANVTKKNRLQSKFSSLLIEKYPEYDIKIVMSEEGKLPYMGLVMFYTKKEKEENEPKLVFTIILTETSNGNITYVFLKDGKPDLDHKGMIQNFSLNQMVNNKNYSGASKLENIILEFITSKSQNPWTNPSSSPLASNVVVKEEEEDLYSGGKKKRSTKKKSTTTKKKKTSTKKKSTKKTSKK